MNSSNWQHVHAAVVRGHQVASGKAGDPRFPGGTIRMQLLFFKDAGLDLSPYYPGTLNVSIAPKRFKVVKPVRTFPNLKWHPTQPAETFSFFDVRLLRVGQPDAEGYIYYPHPETKPEHFQQAGVLELLLPFVEGLDVATHLQLAIPADQILIEDE